VSWQTTTTWKASTGPRLRPEDAPGSWTSTTTHPPTDEWSASTSSARSTCSPAPGRPWRLIRRPRRLRATYTRTGGVMHMLAALDLATGRLFYRIRGAQARDRVPRPAQDPPRRWLRRSSSGLRQLLPHHHANVRTVLRQRRWRWCPADLWLVVDRIESEFAACATSPSTAPTTAATPSRTPRSPASPLAQPPRRAEVNFAVGSSIRSWTHYGQGCGRATSRGE
jgi:hypothetical protein